MKRFPKRDINKLVYALQQIPSIDAAIVYGSIARGDYGPSSDIDVLVIIDNLAVERATQDCFAGLELSRSVQPTIRTKEQLQETDFGLLRKIFQEGQVLFARKPLAIPAADILQIRPWILYSFELTNLTQKEKARFNRQLYSSTKYQGPGGLLGEVGGRKVARGCVIVPTAAQNRMEALFKRFRIKAESLEIWV